MWKHLPNCPLGLIEFENPEPHLPNTQPSAEKSSPRIAFEKIVYDLGDIGQSAKVGFEIRFTNIGQPSKDR